MSVLSVRNVGKRYRLRREARMITKEILLRLLGRPRQQEFWALKGINLDVEPGESLGIIGPNGSGKSTLLKIIAGVTSPTEGEISVEGRISSLLELGTGFHPYLTGRENVYLNGAILGINREEIERKFDSILEFAGIDRFIDTPVKDYSSGMYVRLAFSVAIHSDPDIFLVDEVLSVGDEQFQRRCRAKIRELRDSGKTIVFVSHDLNIVNELCDRVILLQGGEIAQKGSPEDTVDFYLQSVGLPEGMAFLRAGSLELIFNNGRIALFNKERMLTMANGGYSSIESRGRWYDSTTAHWHIDSCSENELVATGTLTRIPVTQRWRIRLASPSLITWDVEMEGKPSAEISRRHVSMMLSREYRRWLTEYEEAEFPNIEFDDANWTPLCPEDERISAVAVMAESEQARTSPIHFEIVERVPWSVLQVSNSDYALNLRILSIMEVRPHDQKALAPGRQLFMSARIGIEESPELVRNRFKGVGRPQIVTLQRDDLKLVFEKGRFRLFWQDKEITKGYAGYSSILQGGLWSDSLTARWRVESCSATEMVATGVFKRVSISETWRISLESPSTVRWDVEMDVQGTVDVSKRQVSLILPTEYTRWFTEETGGRFPSIHPDETEWIHLTDRDEDVRIMGAVAEPDRSDRPSVLFQVEKLAQRVALHVINSSYVFNSRALQVLELRPDEEERVPLGRERFVSARIYVGEPRVVTRKRLKEAHRDRMLEKGDLAAVFHKGRLRLFCKDNEITKGLCGFASIRSGDLWDEPVRRCWQVERVSGSELRAIGTMPRLPARQIWVVRWLEDGTLDWRIQLDVRGKFEMQEIDVGVMLEPDYDEWSTSHEAGVFPPITAETDEWTHLTKLFEPSGFVEARCGETRGDGLPAVRLSFGEPAVASVVNTGSEETARVVQGLKTHAKGSGVFEPGRHEVFSGNIALGKH